MAQRNSSPSGPEFTDPWRHSSSRGSQKSVHIPDGRIAHTLTACTRCRQRKSRCDPGIPRCEPCERSNARCVYYDPARNCTIPRTYILQLREKARTLERELAEAERDIQHAANAEMMVRGAGRIKFKENDEPKYLGPSSGLAITRLVMEMAKQNTDSKSIKDVVPEVTAQEIKDTFTKESSKPTSKIYPMISSMPQEELPPRNLTYRLIDLFVVRAQYMLPTLHEPSFRQDVEDVFNGCDDPCKNFQLRLVIAISMQKLSTAYAGLADSYYLAALPFLEPSLRRMDLGSLQCLVLIAQYSLLTPTRTAAYWVVGVAVKLCQDLRLTEESTITRSPTGEPLNALEIEMRRRLFWIVTSMEYGLSHSLGRPSAFCISHDHIDVKFFELVDDRFITPEGVLPGAKPVLAKCIAIHFFKMRLLQAEIRRTLYLKKRETPVNDEDPWFTQMLAKLDDWVASCPKNDGGSGLSEKWFKGRRNTMIVFMFRPSPQVPEPSLRAAQMCYEASAFNVGMHREQIATGSVDLTWIFTQSLFMALNTILWSLSYPEIRQEHPLDEVLEYIHVALEGLQLAAERWPGVESALRLYRSLISACLKAYDTADSFVVHSPSNHATPSSGQDVATPPPMSSPSSTTTTSIRSTQQPRRGDYSISDRSSTGTVSRGHSADPPFHFSSGPNVPAVEASKIPQIFTTAPPVQSQVSTQQGVEQANYGNQSYVPFNTNFAGYEFDPATPFNTFPSVVPGLPGWDPNFTVASTTASHLAYVDASVDPMWLGSIGDQYSQYSNAPYPVPPWRNRTLSQQEQVELMASLEEDIPDVSAYLVNESATFYRS
ncbi:transcriptional regulator family: Fungal Specific TF [Paecilomyces variotii]|uniref:Putative C6 transcription factor n=1 Tax=Byssochlamys spectabilis TaxID=264951 RepID=A0A443HLG9_BYSSP|nr:putative C6 transcription factor [Paecilomyces variotii]KAJ9194219.1 transcriptional regulator family: Fungal Specific TF [Paecilomyces variotii]KAJ9201518.1 transcriptional regulator family: Fungal Specific TF [Paecilomyces variotii]KAJ9270759.1 transcriptional regulator family: Fungal Specific TF [Paecilomyces variotii]KAJ9275672.1 transcriptional regulator family: Fungal Specific TF [Paecilomyces variotii]KAJ9314533.1 transcriptional regulator family: Fungal Specific TF [Paecilomyces var